MPREPKKPLEQVVRELGRYPVDAFAFVQEAITFASEQVHGAMSEAERKVAEWMAAEEIDYQELCRRHDAGELPVGVAEALHAAGGIEQMNRHVTGGQLCWAARDLARQRWGMMARTVLAKWNVHRTEDVGAIVFALVENDWLQKQESDRLEDFHGVFTFADALDEPYRLNDD
jgi:uncharacterized repeat protein (TIGR04138 family)